MLQQKKEQFRINIRRERNEQIFKLIRSKTPSFEEGKINEVILLDCQRNVVQKDIEEECRTVKYEDIRKKLSQELTIEVVEILSSIILNLSEVDFNQIFEVHNLGERILQMYKEEKDLFYLEKIQYLLGQISKKSMLGQGTLIRLRILPTILEVIPNLEIEFDDHFMISLNYLLTTFVEKISRLNFEEIKETIRILDVVCLKFRKIDYFRELTQPHAYILKQILRYLKLYIDRSILETDITVQKNVWYVVYYLAFEQDSDFALRLLAVQVIGDALRVDEQAKLDIFYYYSNVFDNLLNLMVIHKNFEHQNNSIRANVSKIIKYLMSVDRPYTIGFIHKNQYPTYFLQLIQDEEYHIVLLNMIDAFKFICLYSTFEQCEVLYHDTPNNQSLLSIIARCFQTMKETQRFDFAKPLTELSYGMCKQFGEDNSLKALIKNHRIDDHLSDVLLNCRNSQIASKINTLLSFLE